MDPHDPKRFKEIKLETKNSRSGILEIKAGSLSTEKSDYSNTGDNLLIDYVQYPLQGQQRLRELIIDLDQPKFSSTFSVEDDCIVFLLCPKEMLRVTFVESLRVLYRFMLDHDLTVPIASHSNEEARDILFSDRFRYGMLNPFEYPIPIQQGKGGEISLFGGLTSYAGCNPLDIYQELLSLNAGQLDATVKVMTAQDYTLLLGLPGTGKSTYIKRESLTFISL